MILTKSNRRLLRRVAGIDYQGRIVEMEIWDQLLQVEGGDTLKKETSVVGFGFTGNKPNHLEERPALALEPRNIIGIIEMVPDVHHLYKSVIGVLLATLVRGRTIQTADSERITQERSMGSVEDKMHTWVICPLC